MCVWASDGREASENGPKSRRSGFSKIKLRPRIYKINVLSRNLVEAVTQDRRHQNQEERETEKIRETAQPENESPRPKKIRLHRG